MTTGEDTVTTEVSESELDSLKSRADMMGVKYHPNISVEKLKAKIQESMAASDDIEEVKPVSAKDAKAAKVKAAQELVRVRVTCMDQSKAKQAGVLITAGNAGVGTVRKYIPFDVEWHVPRIIFNALKEAKTQVFYTVKDAMKNEITRSKLANTYSIEVLPKLTEEELKDLAQRQAMANGTA